MKTPALQKDYFQLVQCKPLSVIENQKQCEHALTLMKQLAIKDAHMSKGERQYFEVLKLLIGQYEDKHFKLSRLTPQQVLRSLMNDHSLSQIAIAKIAREYESNISAFLSGKRNLSKLAAKRLGKHFALDPVSFLPLL